MNVDRALFLALTVSLSTVACAAATSDGQTGAGSDDVVAGAACFADPDSAPSPIGEGVCADLWDKAQKQDFAELMSTKEGGKPLFEILGCVPSETGEAGEGVRSPCPTFVADFVFQQCHVFADSYKKSAAAEAIRCVNELPTLTDGTRVADCGVVALEKSCENQPGVEDICARIERAAAKVGTPLAATESKECRTVVGGLREDAREELVGIVESPFFIDFRVAVESIGFPIEEGGR